MIRGATAPEEPQPLPLRVGKAVGVELAQGPDRRAEPPIDRVENLPTKRGSVANGVNVRCWRDRLDGMLHAFDLIIVHMSIYGNNH